MGTSTPLRVQLEHPIARHSPYATSQRSAQSKPKGEPNSRSLGSSRLSLTSSSRSSLIGASLKPTVSMLEEFEVEGLLGDCITRSDSIQTARLSRSTTNGGSSFFQPHPLATAPVAYTGDMGIESHPGDPLSRTSTATTILESPYGPTDPSYGAFDIPGGSFSESGDFEKIDMGLLEEASWIDTAQALGDSTLPTSDMAFRSPLADAYDSEDDTKMDAAVLAPLTYYDSIGSTDTISYPPSTATSDTSSSESEGTPRKRIWETSPDEYVPRPKGVPAQSVASVLEIGMQWEREQQGLRVKGGNAFANTAIGRIRRVHGDAQYMN